MNHTRLQIEAHFLGRVEAYRQEYRSGRAAFISDERERRHANGEVYFAGSWVPRSEGTKLVRGFERHERLVFFEIVVLLIFLVGIARGLSWAFAFFLLPG